MTDGLPNARVIPPDLSTEDLLDVIISCPQTGMTSIVPMWEMRRVLAAVRRHRRHQAKRALLSDRPAQHSSAAVDAAALLRAEQAIGKTIGHDLRP